MCSSCIKINDNKYKKYKVKMKIKCMKFDAKKGGLAVDVI